MRDPGYEEFDLIVKPAGGGKQAVDFAESLIEASGAARDGGARLERCRPGLARQGNKPAADGVEPATPCGSAAPQRRQIKIKANVDCQQEPAGRWKANTRAPGRGFITNA
jgi:hypothetical protein